MPGRARALPFLVDIGKPRSMLVAVMQIRYAYQDCEVISSRLIADTPSGFFHLVDFISGGGCFKVTGIDNTHVTVRVVRADGSLGEQVQWSQGDSLNFKVVAR